MRNERLRDARLERAARLPQLRELVDAHWRPGETRAQTVLRMLELTAPKSIPYEDSATI